MLHDLAGVNAAIVAERLDAGGTGGAVALVIAINPPRAAVPPHAAKEVIRWPNGRNVLVGRTLAGDEHLRIMPQPPQPRVQAKRRAKRAAAAVRRAEVNDSHSDWNHR